MLVITALLMIILSRPELLDYFGDRYIKSEGVEYSSIKGTLFSKIILKDVRYRDFFTAKSLQVSYTLPLLLLKTPKISKVAIKDALIKSKNLNFKQKNGGSALPFSISSLEVSRLKIDDENISINAHINNLSYSKSIKIKELKLLLSSPAYGKAEIKGAFDTDRLSGKAKLYPDKKYLNSLKEYPYPFVSDIKADTKHIKLNSNIESIKLDNLAFKDISLNLNYLFSSKKIDINSTYKIKKDTYEFNTKQSGVINTDGKFTSKIYSTILKSEKKLPFKDISATLKGDIKKIALHVEGGLYKFDIDGDYKSFDIKGGAKGVDIGLGAKSDIDIDATLQISPLVLSGKLFLKNLKDRYRASYKIGKKSFEIDADMLQGGQRLFVRADASNLSYSKSIKIKELKLLLSSPAYGKAEIKGAFDTDRLSGKAKLYPDKKYLNSLKEYPYPFVSDIKADTKHIKLNSNIESIKLDNLAFKDISLNLNYLFSSKKIDINSTYKIKKDTYEFNTKQSGVINTDGKFTSKIYSTILKSEKKLPFKDISATLKGDIKKIALHVEGGLYKFDIDGDYKSFDIKGGAKGVTLGFLDNFPDMFKDEKIDMRTKAVLHISPFKLSGDLIADSEVGKLSAKYKADTKSRLFETVFYPNERYKIWKDYRVDKISPAKITIYSDTQSRVLNIDAKMLNVTLFRKKDLLGGWGNLATGYFDVNGKVDKKSGISLKINANLPSLKKFLGDVGVGGFDKNFFIDAKVHLKSNLKISKDILFKSRVTMPWYKVVLDDKSRYEGKNLWIESTIKNTQAVISGYSFYLLNHHIYSNRASKIALKKEGKVEFKEFWIYDNLLLKGTLDLAKKEGKLHLVGKKFNYKGKEGNITADADITASIAQNGAQKIEGSITLLGGMLSIEPKKGYDVSDEDIVIIQNIRQDRELKRSINIQVFSKKPIEYKIKDVKLSFVPDFTIFQEEGGALEYLGMVTVEDGEIQKAGKKFEINRSEIYLRGANPINPYLNINLLYRASDDVKIKVFIANTLASPLMILASTPPMGQNDIMSYILFGKPAANAFENTKNSQTSISLGTLLYGTGLKKMFQDTTHINIDTLNILSSKDRRFGYEVGASINDKIRVIYKNDTISSIIIQYSLNKSIRIDVDVKESGEGVSILYAKDF